MRHKIMKWGWALFCIVAVTASVALASPAHGTTGQSRPAHAPQIAVLCGGNTFQWASMTSNLGEWAVRWKVNVSACEDQGAVKCKNRFGTYEWEHSSGRWDTGWTGVSCPATWVPVQGNFNFRQNAGNAWRYLIVCYRSCFSSRHAGQVRASQGG